MRNALALFLYRTYNKKGREFMKTDTLKLSITALLAAACTVLGKIATPFIILCVMMAADYASGICKAWKKNRMCSSVGIRGIIKKLAYCLAVVAALGIDYVIAYTARGGSEKLHPVFALAVIAWMTVNESISILENLTAIGVPLPAFLLKIATKLKQSVEQSKEDDNDKL